MKVLFFSMFFFVFGSFISQKEITWEDLDCEFMEVWDEDLNAIYFKPNFNQSHFELEGSLVRIIGCVNQEGLESGFYVLTPHFIESICLVCDIIGDEAIELQLDTLFRNNDFSKEYWVEGTLHLNKDDILQLNYILKDAKIIREVKN